MSTITKETEEQIEEVITETTEETQVETKSGGYIKKLPISMSAVETEGKVQTCLLVEGMINPAEEVGFFAYNPESSNKEYFALDIAFGILKQSRKGVANLITRLGSDTSEFNKGLQSRMFTVINSISQQTYSSAYARWILHGIAKSDVSSYIKGTDGDLETHLAATGGPAASLILLSTAQSIFAHNAAGVNTSNTYMLKDLNDLVASKELNELSVKASKSLVAAGKKLETSSYTKENTLFPGHFGESMKSMVTALSEYGPEVTTLVETAYGDVVKLLTEIQANVPLLSGMDFKSSIDHTAFFVLRAEFMKILSGNTALGSKEDGLLKITLTALNKKNGNDMVSLINDIIDFSYTYQALVKSLQFMDKVAYNETASAELLAFYSGVMKGLKNVSSEEDVLRLTGSIKDNPKWISSLTGVFYSIAEASISGDQIMDSAEYTRMLALMDGVLKKNEFFSIVQKPNVTKLALGSSENTSVGLGSVFTFDKKHISYEDLFKVSDGQKIDSYVDLVDAVSRTLADPSSSPIFASIYKLLAMRSVLSDAVRIRVATGSGPEIAMPFSLHEDARAKVLPKLDSMSYAIMAELGVGYAANSVVRNLALHALSHQIELFEELNDKDRHRDIALYVEQQDMMKFVTETKELISSGIDSINEFVKSGDPSLVISKENVSFDGDLIFTLADSTMKGDLDGTVKKLFSRDHVRASKGVLFNAVHRHLKNPIKDITLHSTCQPTALSDKIKTECMRVAQVDAFGEGFEPKSEASIEAMIDSIRRDLSKTLKAKPQEHAMGKLLTINLDVRKLVEKNDGVSKDGLVDDDYKLIEASSEVMAVTKRRNYVIPGDNSKLERDAFAKISPQLFRIMCAFKPSWKRYCKSSYAVDTESIPYYDEKHTTLRLFEKLGLSPDLEINELEYAFLKETLGKGSVFSLRKNSKIAEGKRARLQSVIELDSETKKGADASKYVHVSFLPLESIYDLFSDSVTVNVDSSKSRLLVVNKLAGSTTILREEDNRSVNLMATAAESDILQRQFVTKDSMVRDIFNEVVLPLASALWK